MILWLFQTKDLFVRLWLRAIVFKQMKNNSSSKNVGSFWKRSNLRKRWIEEGRMVIDLICFINNLMFPQLKYEVKNAMKERAF